jgi:XTP/dITP diphosphohydrolase
VRQDSPSPTGPPPAGFPSRLALATKNPGKIREILQICAQWPVRWLTADRAASGLWPDVEETGLTYSENALLKARAVAEATGLPAVADDSGIEVDALGGDPGLRSARFAGEHATDEQNLLLLIERMAAEPVERRTARYRCVAACAWPDGSEIWAEATCQGRLILERRGGGGFGYDPIFVPEVELGDGTSRPGTTNPARTMAEMPPEEKNRISHRGLAFRALGARLGI